jgi:hypothetical protein
VKHILLAVMMVTACSTERSESRVTPILNQDIPTVPDVPNQTSDALPSGHEIASNGTIATPVVVPEGEEANPLASNPNPTPQTTVDSERITPPNQVTGAYLTAKVLPRTLASDPLRIGLVAMKDDIRIGHDPSIYQTSWQISFDLEKTNPVKILASGDKSYDQIIEFYGSAQEFQNVSSEIKVYLQVKETNSSLSSLVDSVLSELVTGQELPEGDVGAAAGTDATDPDGDAANEPVLADVGPPKGDGLTEVGGDKGK